MRAKTKTDKIDVAGMSHAEREALKQSLAARGAITTRHPAEKIEKWKAAAKRGGKGFNAFVEDALDAWARR